MTKDDLHRLVDELPEESVAAAVKLLERARDPFLAALDAASWDDEPYTQEERAEDEAAWARYQKGEGIPLDQVEAMLEEAG